MIKINQSVAPAILTINPNAKLTGDYNLTISNQSALSNSGTISIKSIVNNGNVTNNGNITINNNLNNNGIFTNYGIIKVNNNFNNNGGTINGDNGSIISCNNVINNAGGGYIRGQDICKCDNISNPLISNSGTIDSLSVSICNTPLPVELLYFKAEVRNKQVFFTWATASETNNDYFTIEKTYNGYIFEFVAKVDGSRNSNKLIEYTAVDENPYTGLSYYRLKQTDYDGHNTDSKLVDVFYFVKKDIEFIVFPNPSNGELMLASLKGAVIKDEVLIVVRDLEGKTYYSKVVMVAKTNDGLLTVIDPYNRIPEGIYIITGTVNDEIYNYKILVQK